MRSPEPPLYEMAMVYAAALLLVVVLLLGDVRIAQWLRHGLALMVIGLGSSMLSMHLFGLVWEKMSRKK